MVVIIAAVTALFQPLQRGKLVCLLLNYTVKTFGRIS